MAISRAFAQLDRAGIAVGWGNDLQSPIHHRSRHGRVHGPFWIEARQAARLTFTLAGKPVRVERWLRQWQRQCEPQVQAPARDSVDLPGRLGTWLQILVLRQLAEEGRMSARQTQHAYADLVPPTTPLPPLNRGPRANGPRDDTGLWALMLQARYARLGNEVDQARRLYGSLLRRCQRAMPGPPTHLHRLDIVRALAGIGIAWCDQQSNRSLSAWRRLQSLSPSFEPGPEPAALWLSSRLAGEYFNLRAIVRRALILDGHAPISEDSATAIVQDFELALRCAIESDSLTLMEAVASNLGFTLWLLSRPLQASFGPEDGRFQAVRWILVGEALCNRHGIGSGSYWNIIYLCRIARGSSAGSIAGNASDPAEHRPPSARVRAQPAYLNTLRQRVVPLQALRQRLAQDAAAPQLQALCDLLLPPPMKDWQMLTDRLLTTVLDEGDAVKPVQRCAAMLENLWQLTLARRIDEAAVLRRRLKASLPVLPTGQRRYFLHELGLMPLGQATSQATGH